MDDQLPNLSFLTDEEKSKILRVLEKDDFLRKKTTEKRIKLREEIDLIESRSIDIPSEHVESARVCIRCRDAFGYFFNTGAFCPKCGFKVCSKCRVNQTEKGGYSSITWLCILCHKYNEYLVQTGEWIHLNQRRDSITQSIPSPIGSPKKVPSKSTSSADSAITVQNLHGSQLIKLSLMPNSKSEIIEEIEHDNLANKSTLINPYLKLTKSKSQNLIENQSPRSQYQKTVIARKLVGSTSTTPTSSRSSSVNPSPEMAKQPQQRYNTLQYRTQHTQSHLDHSKYTTNNVAPVLSMTNSTSNLPSRNPFFPSSTSNDRKPPFAAAPQPLGLHSGNDASSRNNLAVSNNEVDFASVTSSEVDNASSRSDLGIDTEHGAGADKKAKSVNTLSSSNKAVPESLNASGSSSTTAKPPGLFDSVPAITQLLSSPWAISKNENKFVFPSQSSSAIKSSEDSSGIKLTKSFNLEKKTSFSKATEDLKLSQSFAASKQHSAPKKQSQPGISREHSPSKQSNKSGNSSKSTNSLQVRSLKAKDSSKNANSDTDSEEMVQMDQIFATYRESTRVKDKKDPLNESTKSFLSIPSPREAAIDADETLFSSDEEHHSNSQNSVAKPNKLSFRLPKHMSLIKRKKSLQRAGSTRSVDGSSGTVTDGFTPSEMEKHMNGKSKVCLEFTYERVSSNLSIRVISCQDLSCMNNKKNSCDAYVKLYLIVENKEKKDSKRKTSIKKNTCNPKFDEVVRYTLSHSEIDAHKLWISVWNSDTFGRNKLLGDVYVQLNANLFDQKPRFFDLNEKVLDDVIYE